MVLSPVAGLELQYPAVLSFLLPSLTALTLSEREIEKESYREFNKTAQCVCMSTRR